MQTKNLMQLLVALSYYGEHGIPGATSNPVILDFYKKAKNSWVKDDDVAWCAAFVNAVLAESNLPQTGKLNARSFLELGQETLHPEIGDIAVFYRNGKNSPFGHVGFFIREHDNWIYVLGGNQNNEVNIMRYPKERLLAYRTLIIN